MCMCQGSLPFCHAMLHLAVTITYYLGTFLVCRQKHRAPVAVT